MLTLACLPDPFSLELSLAFEDVALLLRQPELRIPGTKRTLAARATRPNTVARATRQSLVWHDTPEGALAADGLALAQRQTGAGTSWRLERLLPEDASVAPPGAPAAIISDTTAPPPPFAGRLLPVAAFDGQERTLTPPGAAVQVVLLQGELRAVAATRPIARVVLTGPGAGALACDWAARMRLQAPGQSLAAEALAQAGRPLPARRLGAPSLAGARTVDDGFALVVAHLAGVILHHAPGARLGFELEPVHQMRVALRRLRSAILLFRRAVACAQLDAVAEQLKQLGRALGPPRDWDVFTTGTGHAVGLAFADDPAVMALLAAAARKRAQGYAALADMLDGAGWRSIGIGLADLALRRPWREVASDTAEQAAKRAELLPVAMADFAARALSRRLEGVTRAGPDLSGLDVAALHDIRLAGKRLRYAAEFFAPLFPGGATRRFLRRMTALQEHLGHLNDAAVARALVAEIAGRGAASQYAAGAISGFVAAGAQGSRRKIERSWQRFLRQEPFWN